MGLGRGDGDGWGMGGDDWVIGISYALEGECYKKREERKFVLEIEAVFERETVGAYGAESRRPSNDGS